MAHRILDIDTGGAGDYTSLNAGRIGVEALGLSPGDVTEFVCRASTGAAESTAAGALFGAVWAGTTIVIRTAASDRPNGLLSANKYRMGRAIIFAANNLTIRIDGLVIDRTLAASPHPDAYSIFFPYGTFIGANVLVENCVIKSGNPAATGSCIALFISGGGGVATYRNCLIYNAAGKAGEGIVDVRNSPNYTVAMDNLTVIKAAANAPNVYVVGAGATARLRNVLAVRTGGGGCIVAAGGGAFTAGTTNNATTDATAPGTINFRNQVFTFVDAAAGNYKLAHDDTGALLRGASLNAEFDRDIAGVFRTEGYWDIGAFQTSRPPARGAWHNRYFSGSASGLT